MDSQKRIHQMELFTKYPNEFKMNYYLIYYEMPKIRKLEKNMALARQIATMYLKKYPY